MKDDTILIDYAHMMLDALDTVHGIMHQSIARTALSSEQVKALGVLCLSCINELRRVATDAPFGVAYKPLPDDVRQELAQRLSAIRSPSKQEPNRQSREGDRCDQQPNAQN